ncbi:MAG TPA: hypothetical protein VJ914_23890 [Pseudonocardiaceae bacterium]|nr:hypothetical protein [Pseudonocardiaceae bacterium]
MSLAPRVVLVHRRTEYAELLARHGTRGQTEFFLASRGRDVVELARREERMRAVIAEVAGAIPLDWRRGSVERADLARFLFAPEDIVVVVGQDGLVANVAKYLSGQPVIGINPEPERNSGVLVPHPPSAVADLLRSRGTQQRRTMVEIAADDGQRLLALNEIYLGNRTHQTSRYTLRAGEVARERQASSGILVGTGTGATGWCGSVWQERHSRLALPGPEERRLLWFVREAWPSPGTSTASTEGELTGAPLTVEVESDQLVAFGDGIESDAIQLGWGQRLTLGLAEQTLCLVR